MPYYITLQFDPAKEEYDEERLIERFICAGASFRDDIESGRDYFYEGHMLFFGRHIQEAHDKGMWVSVHFSWGFTMELFKEELLKILDLAEKVGCKVYDGQLSEYIKRENVDSIANGFGRMAGIATGLFGTVDKEKHQEILRKSKKKSRKNVKNNK